MGRPTPPRPRRPRVFGCLIAAALGAAAGCARRTEVIGRLLDDGGPGSDAEGDGLGDTGPRPETPAGDGASDGPGPTSCAPDPPLPATPAPTWTCAGVDNCLRDPLVEPAAFDAASPDLDPTHQPEIVYPLLGSVHPPYLSAMTVQWKRQNGAAQTQFLLQIQGASATYRFFVPERRPPNSPPPDQANMIYEVPAAVWRHIGGQQRGSEVSLTVTALDPAARLKVQSRPVTFGFSRVPIQGALHYLSTSDFAIRRHVFGATGSEVIVARGSAANPGGCGGCHSVSQDGGTIAFSSTYAGDLGVVRTDARDTPVKLPAEGISDGYAPAVSPGGAYVIARDKQGTVTVLDVTGTAPVVVETHTAAKLGGRIDYPEFSRDGRFVVAGRASLTGSHMYPYSAVDSEIVRFEFDDGRLGLPVRVAGNANEHFSHPSWSPDGRWIVFVAGTPGADSHGYAQTQLALVSSAGGNVRLLGRATQTIRDFATYPKFAPFQQDDCRVAFIAFQSHMDYGFLARNSAVPGEPRPNLWLAAIDLSRPTLSDPSYAPVWLSFQDPNDSNLLPSWSEHAACGTPGAPGCGAGAECRALRCAPLYP